MSVAVISPLLHMTDVEYQSLSLKARAKRELDLAPSWYKPLRWTRTSWDLGELVVLLTNRKRRALHDFIAGTVVVHAFPDQLLEPTAGRAVEPL
jgi:hypothetical protein